MEAILELGGLLALLALVLVWKKRRAGRSAPPTAVLPKPASAADDAYRVGFGVGMLGGSIEDAAIVQNAIRAVEQKTGQKANGQTVGTALGMRNPPNSPGGPS